MLFDLHDIDGMTVEQHHKLCLGVLALCHAHVPVHLQRAILEGLESAKQMGAPISPENVARGMPLCIWQ